MVITEVDKVLQVPVSHFWVVSLQSSIKGVKNTRGYRAKHYLVSYVDYNRATIPHSKTKGFKNMIPQEEHVISIPHLYVRAPEIRY